MKTQNDFLVKVQSRRKESVTYGGLTLITPDASFKQDEYGLMNNFGEVLSVPYNYEEGIVEVGDTIWFHHNVVINQDNAMSIGDVTKETARFRVDDDEQIYHVQYEPFGRDNLAYIVRKKDGTYHTIGDVFFCEPNKDRETAQQVGSLLLLQNQNQNIECNIVYSNDVVEGMGAGVGSRICVAKDSDYEFEVDGVKLWRMFSSDIEYIINEDNSIKPVGRRVIVEMDETPIYDKYGLLIPENQREVRLGATVIEAGEESGMASGERVFFIKTHKLPLTTARNNRLFITLSEYLLHDEIFSQLESGSA